MTRPGWVLQIFVRGLYLFASCFATASPQSALLVGPADHTCSSQDPGQTPGRHSPALGKTSRRATIIVPASLTPPVPPSFPREEPRKKRVGVRKTTLTSCLYIYSFFFSLYQQYALYVYTVFLHFREPGEGEGVGNQTTFFSPILLFSMLLPFFASRLLLWHNIWRKAKAEQIDLFI